ncbi:MAG: hypothetical protein E6R03_17955 [Hyphomicrobiaceae bacterium]|nr:MAG: hypothetical protein E6R03_17955 [Hyphomicrobiaceae bacterium]
MDVKDFGTPGRFSGSPVPDSADLKRIAALPVREKIDGHVAAQKWTEMFRRPVTSCDCVKRFGRCLTAFNAVQGEALEEFSRVGGLYAAIGVGHGKALALDTRIPTPTGWTTMGALTVGDTVFDSAGAPCRVTHVTDVQLHRECFEVVFSDGSKIVADADHRWLTRSYLERRQLDRGAKQTSEPKIRTTKEIRETLFHRHNRNHAIDVAGALQLPDAVLPLDPYLLGIWLGDGSSKGGEVTSMDPAILESFVQAGFKRGHSVQSGRATTQYFLGLGSILRRLGLINNKHVPSAYLRSSFSQRLALLQGLMDSDGCATTTDNTVEFCNTNPLLAAAVFELAASLGQKPTIARGRATLYGKDCGEKLRVKWRPTLEVFRLSRKNTIAFGRYKQSQIKTRRYITAVNPIASVPVKCITVDSPDHTYLCGDAMIPTHNTAISIFLPLVDPKVRTALLLIPAYTRSQFFEVDFPQWSVHFYTPNLFASVFDPALPTLHVLSYSELSLPKNSDVLTGIRPDLVIADEAHCLKDRQRPRFQRLKRQHAAQPTTRYAFMSGTLMAKSIKDSAHLAHFALRNYTPYPIAYNTLDHWSAALDPLPYNAPPGKLKTYFGDAVLEGFGQRVRNTPGVVTTPESSVQCSLILNARNPKMPADMALTLKKSLKDWQRPDGEELVEATEVNAVARQLALGFYYRRIFPHGEPEPLIREWLEIRKEWLSEVRAKLKHATVQLDSPKLLEQAATRYLTNDKTGPQWKSRYFVEWKKIEKQVKPETETCWLNTFALDDAARWMAENTGIVWCEFVDFGRRLSKLTHTIYYGGGPKASRLIRAENGSRNIIASIDAHGTGKNLQAFSNQLVTTPPASGGIWEQLIGRTWRQGQAADEVFVNVYLHTEEYREALNSARRKAVFEQTVENKPQALQCATLNLTLEKGTGK